MGYTPRRSAWLRFKSRRQENIHLAPEGVGQIHFFESGKFRGLRQDRDARTRAAELARTMIATGQHPNALARTHNAAEVTLRQAMDAYRDHMMNRTQKPAKAETLRVYDRVMRRHAEWGWSDRKVREIDIDEIQKKSLAAHAATPTATGQAFR